MCEPSKNGSSSFRETADPSPKDHRRVSDYSNIFCFFHRTDKVQWLPTIMRVEIAPPNSLNDEKFIFCHFRHYFMCCWKNGHYYALNNNSSSIEIKDSRSKPLSRQNA